jgi:hypothetical protein
MDNNIAVDMVIVSKTDWEVKFERVTKAIECEKEQNQETNQSSQSGSEN